MANIEKGKRLKKVNKKLDSIVVTSLTKVCEQAKEDIHGFAWVTHTADYKNFPASLLITCVFDTQHNLANAQNSGQQLALMNNIFEKLRDNKIVINDPNKTIRFDTEDSGAAKRLLE